MNLTSYQTKNEKIKVYKMQRKAIVSGFVRPMLAISEMNKVRNRWINDANVKILEYCDVLIWYFLNIQQNSLMMRTT